MEESAPLLANGNIPHTTVHIPHNASASSSDYQASLSSPVSDRSSSYRGSTCCPTECSEIPPLTWKGSIGFIFRSTYMNALMPFIPLGVVSSWIIPRPAVIFVVNFLSLIPLARILSLSTDELALQTSQTTAALCNVTFGNFVELIVALLALHQGAIEVVQSSLLGSILSNLLLVLGASCLVGSLHHGRQVFTKLTLNALKSMLAIFVCVSLLSISVFYPRYSAAQDRGERYLLFSRIGSVFLLLLYIAFIYQQLPQRTKPIEPKSSNHSDQPDPADQSDHSEQHNEVDAEEPSMLLDVAVATLLLSTLLVSICARNLLATIGIVTQNWNLSPSFMTVILLPIVGNAVEHATAVTAASKNRMDLVLGISLGSGVQIALFVQPFCVLMGWLWGQEIGLGFETRDTFVVTTCIWLVVTLINRESTWLKGVSFLLVYLLIAIAYFVA